MNKKNMEKRTKKTIYASILLVFAILLIILSSSKLVDKRIVRSDRGRVVAVVGGLKVYEGDLSDRLKTLSSTTTIKIEEVPQPILRAIILEAYVNNRIDKEASKLGYRRDEEIKRIIRNFRTNLIRERFLNDKVYSSITDKDVENEYNKLVESVQGKEERKVKHILVENEDEIERIRMNILRSGNFEKMAREKSLDKTSAENGGDIGYILKSELVPEFGDVAFILKVGAISKPVKTQYGWHIIKVEDIRPAQFLPFDQVKDKIKQKLQQDAIRNYLVSLTNGVNVDFKIDFEKLPAINLNLGNRKDNINNGGSSPSSEIKEDITQE